MWLQVYILNMLIQLFDHYIKKSTKDCLNTICIEDSFLHRFNFLFCQKVVHLCMGLQFCFTDLFSIFIPTPHFLTLALQLVLKSVKVNPPWFFSFKIVLTFLGSLNFYADFQIRPLICIEKHTGFLLGLHWIYRSIWGKSILKCLVFWAINWEQSI